MKYFFKRIRQKLIEQNRFTRYLAYAAGEILLVVIGILLALQVNKWNEQRKQEILEIQYLERLVVDLAHDTNYYNKRTSYSLKAIHNLDAYLHEAYNIQESLEDVKDLFNYLSLDTDHLTSNNSTYRELTSTGKLNIFKNQELKKSIVDHYRLNEEIAANILEFNLVSTQFLVEANRVVRNLGKFFRLDNTPYDDPKMLLEGEWKFMNEFSSE